MRSLSHIGDYRGEQMRDTFVDRHLEHLGVDHQQTHITRFGFVQQAQNHRVNTHRFTGACGTRHQHVRHFGEICDDGVAHNVFTQSHGQHGLGFVVNIRTQDFAQANRLAFGIGQFQSHVVFAGDGFDHADRYQRE